MALFLLLSSVTRPLESGTFALKRSFKKALVILVPRHLEVTWLGDKDRSLLLVSASFLIASTPSGTPRILRQVPLVALSILMAPQARASLTMTMILTVCISLARVMVTFATLNLRTTNFTPCLSTCLLTPSVAWRSLPRARG